MINLKKFYEFLSIPSISSEPFYKNEVRKCALWVVDYLKTLDFEIELWETKGHPVIFAKKLVDPNKPTLLIYNHYDVQPVDPLDLWKTPPFEPHLIDGQIYARGAQDNKGQCFYVLEALRFFHESQDSYPINIKLLIEGEEECGSANLGTILKDKSEQLQADDLAIVDLGIPGLTTPAVTLGTRGLVTFEMEITGSKVDLHSGSHGGLVFNPIHALVQLLSEIRDDTGKICIPGFYDDVVEFPQAIKDKIDFSFEEKNYQKSFGTSSSGGETSLKPLERVWLRPTFEINGIHGGYTGDGFKTVIPSHAHAKFSCRLVANQNPSKIGILIKNYFENKAPEGTVVKITINPGSGEAARSDPYSKGVLAFTEAYSEIFNIPCSYILEGASIPIIPELAKASGAKPVLVGLGLLTDQIHSPNEHFGLDRLEMGAKIIVKAIQKLGNQS